MTENKKTIRTVIAVVILCLLAVGYYAYLSDRNARQKREEQLTEKDELLLYDMDQDYPHEPSDVVKLYSRILCCIYNERLSGEDLEKMVQQLRKLYAQDFASAQGNSQEEQISKLEQEIESYGDEEHKITNYTVGELSQTEYAQVDGKQAAGVEAVYTLRIGNEYSKEPQTYILVQDDDDNWKILGWRAQTSESGESTTQEP